MSDVRRSLSEEVGFGVAVAVGEMDGVGVRRSTEAGDRSWKVTGLAPLADRAVVRIGEGAVAEGICPVGAIGAAVGSLAKPEGFCMMLVPANTIGMLLGSASCPRTSPDRTSRIRTGRNARCNIVTSSIPNR